VKEREGIVILAVEDEPLNRRLLHVVLEPAGYTVIDAGTLAEAREQLDRVAPDLVLLDLRLPDGEGLSLAREIRARPDLDALPIVAATASAMPPVPQQAEEAGCSGFLVKPIRPGVLLQEVRSQLERVGVRHGGGQPS
jgi:CheY-like chemotaxis protein